MKEVVLQGPLGPFPWGGHTASTKCHPSRGTSSPFVARKPWTSLCSWGFALLTRAPPGIELRSFRLCAPPVYRVLIEFNPLLSPFSLFSLVPAAVSNFPLFSSCFGEGCFSCILHPTPYLCPLSTLKSGSLPAAASRFPSSPLCATYLLNSVA